MKHQGKKSLPEEKKRCTFFICVLVGIQDDNSLLDVEPANRLALLSEQNKKIMLRFCSMHDG
jgi:hypothetical protein